MVKVSFIEQVTITFLRERTQSLGSSGRVQGKRPSAPTSDRLVVSFTWGLCDILGWMHGDLAIAYQTSPNGIGEFVW